MFPDSAGLLGAAREARLRRASSTSSSPTAPSTPTSSCPPAARWSGARCARYPQKYVIFTQPVIEPLGESRSDTDIIFALAEKLGLDYDPSLPTRGRAAPANGAPDSRRLRRRPRLDARAERHDRRRAQEASRAACPCRTRSPCRSRSTRRRASPPPAARWSSPRRSSRSTPTGRDRRPADLPRAQVQPGLTPELAADYPLVLGTGSRLPMFIHSRTFRLPWTRSLRPRRRRRPQPRRRAPLRHRPGRRDRVCARPPGAIRVKANLTELAPAGRRPHVPRLPGGRRQLAAPGRLPDPISGFPGYKALLCAVRKVAPHADAESRPGGDADEPQ